MSAIQKDVVVPVIAFVPKEASGDVYVAEGGGVYRSLLSNQAFSISSVEAAKQLLEPTAVYAVAGCKLVTTTSRLEIEVNRLSRLAEVPNAKTRTVVVLSGRYKGEKIVLGDSSGLGSKDLVVVA